MRLTRSRELFVMLAAAAAMHLVQSGCAAEKETIIANSKNMNAAEIIQHWIAQIRRVPAGDFTPISDFSAFQSRARTESPRWCGLFLAPAANPHTATNRASHSFYAAKKAKIDLLRHELSAQGLPLTVFEGINFLILRVPPPQSKPWTRESIEATVRWALNTTGARHHWVFVYPQTIGEGTLISTAPTVDPTQMENWSERADLLISQGELFAICYKRYPPTLGLLYDAQWFEDELRGPERK